MIAQVYDPLNYRSCGPTPDYVSADNIHDLVAYGLMSCWFIQSPMNPYADPELASFGQEELQQLREQFLNIVESVAKGLWKGELEYASGDVNGDWGCVSINHDEDDPIYMHWTASLTKDAVMFALHCTGADPETFFVTYNAIEDRQHVVNTILKARKTTGFSEVDTELLLLAKKHSMLVVRAGDCDDYHKHDTIDEAAEYLRGIGVTGSLARHGKYGVETDDFGGNNYISLYWANAVEEPLRSVTDQELADLNHCIGCRN